MLDTKRRGAYVTGAVMICTGQHHHAALAHQQRTLTHRPPCLPVRGRVVILAGIGRQWLLTFVASFGWRATPAAVKRHRSTGRQGPAYAPDRNRG